MIRILYRIFKWLFIVFGFISSVVFAVGYLIGSRKVKGRKANTFFDGKHFRNVVDDDMAAFSSAYKDMARRIYDWDKPKWQRRTVPHMVPEARVEGDTIVVTLVNHSTVLIQTQGINILTDPIWADRPSPLSYIGPGRYQNPGIKLEDLPQIDLVLLSHNHYDHMDISTLKWLYTYHHPKILTHLGNSSYLARHGIPDVVDMIWADQEKISDKIDVVSVPAQHDTERWLTDRNNTLWGGFVIRTKREGKNGDIYFAGDTGYGPFLKQIKQSFPDGFCLGLIPIGAYAPRWYTKEVHTDPEEAYKIKQDLHIEQAVAIHHSTFQLGDEPQDEPIEWLERVKKEHADETFVALANGQHLTIE